MRECDDRAGDDRGHETGHAPGAVEDDHRNDALDRQVAAGHAGAASARSARAGRSGCCRAQAAFLPVAPFDSPFAVVESPAVDEIDERRVGSGAVVERRAAARASPDSPRAGARSNPSPSSSGAASAKKRRRSDSSRNSIRVSSPTSQRWSASEPAGVIVNTRRERPPFAASSPAIQPAASRRVELRVDLAVARRPEVADRPVDGALDVVAAHRPAGQQSENRPGNRRSAPYIVDDISQRGICQERDLDRPTPCTDSGRGGATAGRSG